VNRFPQKCHSCRQQAVQMKQVDYSTVIHHGGYAWPISIPSMWVPKCTKCGEISPTDEFNEQVTTALRKAAGLLDGREIYSRRKACGWSQEQLANAMGVSLEKVSRWESGGQVQTATEDLRLRNRFAEVVSCPLSAAH